MCTIQLGVGDPGVYFWVLLGTNLEHSSPAMLPQVQTFGDANLLWEDPSASAVHSSPVTLAPTACIINHRLITIHQRHEESLEVDFKWPLRCKPKLQNSNERERDRQLFPDPCALFHWEVSQRKLKSLVFSQSSHPLDLQWLCWEMLKYLHLA